MLKLKEIYPKEIFSFLMREMENRVPQELLLNNYELNLSSPSGGFRLQHTLWHMLIRKTKSTF